MDAPNILRVTVDLCGVEETPSQGRTLYGGRWRVGDAVGPGRGDDAGESHYDDIRDLVVRACDEKWPEDHWSEDEGFVFDVWDCLTSGLDGDKFDMLVVNEGGGAWHAVTVPVGGDYEP